MFCVLLCVLGLGVMLGEGARPEPCGSQAAGCTCSFDKQEVWCEGQQLVATPRIGRGLARHVKRLSLRYNEITHLNLAFLDTLPHLEVINLQGQLQCVTLDFNHREVDDVEIAGKLFYNYMYLKDKVYEMLKNRLIKVYEMLANRLNKHSRVPDLYLYFSNSSNQ